jgi:hypothetical protein
MPAGAGRVLASLASPVEHASRLYHDYLPEQGLVDGCILASDLQEVHRQMCLSTGLLPRPWTWVGRAYCLLSAGGQKKYALINGRRERLHVLPSTDAQNRLARRAA